MMFFLFSESALYVSCQVVAEIPRYPSTYIVIYKRKRRLLHFFQGLSTYCFATFTHCLPAQAGAGAANISGAIFTTGVSNSNDNFLV